MSTSRGRVHASTLDAEGAELGDAHLARWLDELLPPGPCLVWAGGMTLAAVLAGDRRRPVLLVEPRAADLEDAGRRIRPGVRLTGVEALDAGQPFASAVIVAGADDDLELVLRSLLDGPADRSPDRPPLDEPVVAVVAEPTGVATVLTALERWGRPAVVARQHLRLASTLGIDGGAAPAECLEPRDGEATAVVIVSGSVPLASAPEGSVLVGPDAGPTRAWAEAEWVRQSIRQVDAELRAVDAVRLEELEARLQEAEQRRHELEAYADGLERRVADLEGSTSWRVTAPMRWVSDRTRRS